MSIFKTSDLLIRGAYDKFQQLLEGPMEVLLCEHVNHLRNNLVHLFNCLITIASELKE